MYQMKRQLHTEACLHGDRGGWQTLHNNTIIKAYNGSLNLSAAELKINNWAKGENKKHSCHSLWGITQVLFFNHLCLRALWTHTGGSQFDHLSQLGDGLGRGVGSLGQFLLARCGSSNQQLGVLHQRFGRLQDALPGGRGDTHTNAFKMRGVTSTSSLWAISLLTPANLLVSAGAALSVAPVISEGVFVLGVQRSGRGKHDGGVQVRDDARNRAGGCDTGLGAFVPGLQRRQHQRHLQRAACLEALTAQMQNTLNEMMPWARKYKKKYTATREFVPLYHTVSWRMWQQMYINTETTHTFEPNTHLQSISGTRSSI